MSSTRISRRVNAPRANVYRALLDARAVATWMVPTGMTSQVHAFDAREGGSFRISLTYDEPTGTGKTTARTDTYHGRFVKLVANQQVVEVVEFETTDPALRGEMTITYTLADADGGTEVLAVHDGLPPGLSTADNEVGWRMSLAKLAALVEAEANHTRPSSLPPPAHLLAVFMAGFVVRAWLIWREPSVFGGDSILRLANWEHVILSHQLPLPQLLVHLLHPLMPGPTLVRYIMAIAGALAGVSFYLLATTIVPADVALAGTAFFVGNPMILTHSTVPYQEIFLLAGGLAAFYAALTGRWYLASAALAVACLARYEGWIACPAIGLLYVHRKGWSVRRVAEAVLLFGWVPLLWMAYHHGITQQGSFAIEPPASIQRFFRWAYIGYITARNATLPVLVLALFGAWQLARRGLWRHPTLGALSLYFALFLVALLASAQGMEPNTERYVTPREAHFPLAGFALLATVGLRFLPRFRRPIAAACGMLGFWLAQQSLHDQARRPGLALSIEAAQYLGAHLRPGEQAVVLAAPITGVESYLDHLVRKRGSAGRAAGVAILNQLDNRPEQFHRILVHSRFGKRQLQNYSQLIVRTPTGPDTVVKFPVPETSPDWLLVWSDFRPTSAGEARLAELVREMNPVETMRRDSLSLAIYRLAPNLRP